jgi:hypothetical protein
MAPHKIPLPAPVVAIYNAVQELEALYPNRKFTPDGHLVGSIGEVIAAKELGLTLYRASHPGHDGCDNEYWPTCADEYWPTLRYLTC